MRLQLADPAHHPNIGLLPFADDLDYAGLDAALERSLQHFARVAQADPGRTLAFGKERVPFARVVASLRRFRELVAARPTPAALQEALRREFRVFRSVGDGRGTVLFTGYYLPELEGSLSRGGRYTLDNVVPACRSCNASKCNDEVTGWLRRKRLDERAFLVRHVEVRRALEAFDSAERGT